LLTPFVWRLDRTRLATYEARQRFWEGFLDSRVPALVAAGDLESAHRLIDALLRRELVRHAASGRIVVRLKRGDPFVWRGSAGAGGSRYPFEVVPGISAALAAPAAALVPVTHRHTAAAFAVFSGQDAGRASDGTVDWELAARVPTAIFLMVPHTSVKSCRGYSHRADPRTRRQWRSSAVRSTARVWSGAVSPICPCLVATWRRRPRWSSARSPG
jgi:siroheme synthase